MLDILTTYIVIENHYGYEANPIAVNMLNIGGYHLLMVAGFAVSVFASLAFVWIQKIVFDHDTTERCRKIITMFIYFFMAFNTDVIFNNVYVLYMGIMV
jgi:hypothetical protein